MDAAEALDRAAKALTTAEDNATLNPEGAQALVAIADGWGRLAHSLGEAAAPVVNAHVSGPVWNERELAEAVREEIRRQQPPPASVRRGT